MSINERFTNENSEKEIHRFPLPFGEVSCEYEVQVLQEDYQEYYYNLGRFNSEALERNTYLIVGRRGAGKTSLAKYFEFQNEIKNARSIDVDEPEAYEDIMRHITAKSGYLENVLIARIVKLWDYVLWSLIFNEYQAEDPVIRTACMLTADRPGPARLIADILKQLLTRYITDDEGAIANEVEEYLSSSTFDAAKKKVLELTRKSPVFIAVDTVERYDKEDDNLMKITAALIQSANGFNITYSGSGIHVKAFIAAEIFPHIKESAISNTTKFIRRPVHLHWRPRDLIHLICWRFHRYLEHQPELTHLLPPAVDWGDFDNVLETMWFPFFGEDLINGNGLKEKTFPYILRHTQMRPRQLVALCNEIARVAGRQYMGVDFKRLRIAQIIKETERDLSDEVLNSYARIYPKVAEIVDALRTSPMMFAGSHLDKVASTTAYAWPAGEYSPANFRRLVAELGIVGRVRSHDDKSGIAAADFEYTLTDRLALRSNDQCVIHPMFYTKLQTRIEPGFIVYPFPDHPDFDEMRARWSV